MTVLDSLMVRLGFAVDAKGLEGFAKNVDAIKQKMEGLKHLGEAYLGFEGIKKVGEFVKSGIEGMASIQEFSERVDLAATDVAALGRVATENGSSLEGMEGSISSLNATLGQAASGFPRAEKMLSRFGLKAKDAHGQIKTFDAMLGEVANKMEGASTGKRLAMANALGIDPKLIPLLREGGENFTRLREQAMKAGVFKDSDYERAHETEKLFNKADGAFLRLKQRLAIGLMPTVNELLRKFIAWVSDAKNIAKIQGYINDVVKVAKLLWENASKIAAVFAVIYAHKYGMMFLDWGEKLMKVAKGLAAANGATALLQGGFTVLKGILAGGLIAALVLVAEDLWVFYQGGTSVTGWLLTQFPYAVEVAQGALALLSGSLVALTTGSGPLGLLVVGIGGFIIAANDLRASWGPVMDWFDEALDSINKKIALVIDSINAPLRWMGIDVPKYDQGQWDPKGTAKTRENSEQYDEKDFNARMYRFNQHGWGDGGWRTQAASGKQDIDNSIKIGEVHVHEAASGEETWNRIQKAARDQTRSGQLGSR